MRYEQIEQVVSPVGRSFAENASMTTLEGGYEAEDHIGYIESDAAGAFEIYPSDDTQCWYTFVPSAKVTSDWNVEVITGYTFSQVPERSDAFPGGYGVYVSTSVENDSFVVLYKDPHVFAVPDSVGGGWLMLVVRVRVRRSVADAYVAAHPEIPDTPERAAISAARRIEGPDHGHVISDIVAFHSPEQTFRDVRATGPYLVVDSLTGIDPGGRVPAFRTWLGAPTGAFVLDAVGDYQLYVYYNAEKAVSPDGTTFDGLTDQERAYGAVGFEGGIGVKQIEGYTVQTALATGPSPEGSWRRTSEWSGRIQTTIRRWMSTEDGLTVEQTLEDAVRAAIAAGSIDPDIDESGVSPDASDPVAMNVDGRLMLFLSVNTTNGDNGNVQELYEDGSTQLGLWRLAALPERTPLVGGGRAVFGRDFIVYHGTYASPSPNLLVPSYRLDGVNYQTQDADPVPRGAAAWFPYGADWWLFARPEWRTDGDGDGAVEAFEESIRYAGSIDDALLVLL